MEEQRPELIPYFHSSQGPAEAAEPMKAAFRREDTHERVSGQPLWVPGPARLPRGPIRQNRFQSPSARQSPRQEDSEPWASASRPLRP